MGLLKRLLIIVCIIFGYKNGSTQTCKIIVPPYTCLNDLVSAKLTLVGGTPQTYNWLLGDGRSAIQAQPSFSYSKTGTYTITAVITYVGGITCTVTAPITVYDLPKAQFSLSAVPDFCNNQQKVCITDNSMPGTAGNPLVKRTFLWGDGLADTTTPGTQKTICHNYTAAGEYLLAMEVTDDKGCLAKSISSVTVYDTIAPAFSFDTQKIAGECKLVTCFTNTSTPEGNSAKYAWFFGDGNADSVNNNACHEYAANGIYTVLLVAENTNGCKDTARQQVIINKPTVNTNLKMPKAICLNDNLVAFNDAVNPASTEYRWTVSDSAGRNSYSMGNTNPVSYKFIAPGKYYVTLQVEVDSCVKEITDSVDVMCPQANFSSYNDEQCVPGDTTYLCADICRYKANNVVFMWDLIHGEQCTTDTKNGRNSTRNCRYSLDENVKHLYDFRMPGDKFSHYKPLLITKDTVTGCTDIGVGNVILGTLDMSKFTVSAEAEELCTIIKFSEGNKRKVRFTLGGDSAVFSCRISVNGDCEADTSNFYRPNLYDITYEYTTPYDDSAYKTFGLAFRNGEDSVYSGCNKFLRMGSFCYDTAYIPNVVNIMPAPRPQLSSDTVFKDCRPYTLAVKLKDSIQKNIKSIRWVWGDGNEETYYPAPGDSILPQKQHFYSQPGLYSPEIIMTNTRNCLERQPLKLAVGYINRVVKNSVVCAGANVKFDEIILYYDTVYQFWKDANRSLAGKEELWWDYGDGKGFVKKLQGQGGYFATEGIYNLRMATKDSTGCRDTVVFSVKAIQPVAGFRQMRDTIYCNDNIVQFYDSSLGSRINPNEKIVGWNWDFGDYNGAKPQQNPLYIFKTFGDKKIQLVVRNATGCYDTAYSYIYFKGPEPSFEIISDSIGCAPLVVNFKNTSKNATTWVWNMGDSSNTILSAGQDTNVSFTYSAPGTYYITLHGGDSIYNHITTNRYFCSAIYPQFPLVKKVIVSPKYQTAFTMPDTVCVNKLVLYNNQSPAALTNFTWDFGNGNTMIMGSGLATNVYTDTGLYTVNLKANVSLPIDSGCVSDATHKIFVQDIKAGFDISLRLFPAYEFINTSSVSAVRYEWDFGDPASGLNNFSSQKNPVHAFSSLDTFMVCLVAYNSSGCADRICEEIIYDYHPYLFIPNVFTPDGRDTVNGAFDIVAHICQYYHVNIYNRWGEKVFEGFEDGYGNADRRNWDGLHYKTGEPCPSGVYFVVFDYEIAGWEGQRRYNGTLTLFREE